MRRALLRLLIRAYPRAFREAYGREMVQLFEHQRREARYTGVLGATRFWFDITIDVAEGVCRQWLRGIVSRTPSKAPGPSHRREPAPRHMIVHRSSEKATMDSLIQDLRYALRGLSQNPGWALAAAATLTLGLGSTIAIFSVVHDVVVRPLPYQDPERIQVVKGRNVQHGRIYNHTS